MNVVNVFTGESLAIRVNRRLKAVDVIDILADLFSCTGLRYMWGLTMALCV